MADNKEVRTTFRTCTTSNCPLTNHCRILALGAVVEAVRGHHPGMQLDFRLAHDSCMHQISYTTMVSQLRAELRLASNSTPTPQVAAGQIHP
jgi:hypothetical protein